jgi:hypothetical protein
MLKHASQIPYQPQPDWYVVSLTPVGICIFLYVLLHFSPPFLVACLKRCQQICEPETNAPGVPVGQPDGLQPKPRQMTAQAKREEDPEVPEAPVHFTKYLL